MIRPSTKRVRASLRAAAAAALLLLAAVPSQAGTPEAELAGLLRQSGIRPVDPPVAAADFRLPDLSGGEAALSDAGGRWVVLTFFATWCGPCRSEMPSLERLHRDRESDGLTVLGVSTDAGREPLAPFVKELGLTFPILWDRQGEAARLYQATSIPLSYLIDPAGRIVGISRGARDWSALTATLDRALALLPPDPEAAPVYAATGGGQVEIPERLVPPTAEVSLAEAELRAGRPFHLDIEVQWSGDFDEYLLHPPQVHLPEGVEEAGMSAVTSSQAGRNRITYRVELAAAEPGRFALDPVELLYTPRGESEPVASRIAGPTVTVRPWTLAGMTAGGLALAASGLLTGALAALLLGRTVRHRRRGPDSDPATARHAFLSETLSSARRLRLEGGDPGACLRALAEVLEQLGATEGEAGEEITRALERTRYGGEAPPPELLDRLQRQAERLLEEIRPRPEEDARKALRLRRQEGPAA